MGVREIIRRRQSLMAALAILMIAGGGVAIFLQARDFGSPGFGELYYSNDDGKTFFADSATKVPPFDKDGKPAYRAHVFECEGKRVVGYLSRYTPEAIKALEEAKAARAAGRAPPNVGQLATIGSTGMQVKKPSDPNWVSQADSARATMIRVFRCPDGSTPQEVDP